MNKEQDAYIKLICHSYMGIVWTHKIHEKQADIYTKTKNTINIIKIVSSSLTAAGLLSVVFASDEIWLKLIAAILSFITLSIETLSKSFDYDSLIQTHKNTAALLLELRDKYQLLILQAKQDDADLSLIKSDYQKIERKKHEVYKTAPRTSDAAVKKAGVAINIQKDNNYTISEINECLPDCLKLEE